MSSWPWVGAARSGSTCWPIACSASATARPASGPSQAKLAIRASDGAITLADAAGKPLTEQAAPQYQAGGGYDVRFALSNDERLYGLGDVSRENVMRRGGVYEFWVLNVKAYIPIPVVFSSRGWGLCRDRGWG